MKKKRPVLQDVADRVGVTKMTVSRFLRNPEQVSVALRGKIAAALDELGYIPNRAPDILSNATSRAIGVNGDAVDPKSVTSWADLWKPEYKGSLLLTDDAREVFQMALRKLGYSGNTTDPKEIEAAYNELKKLMPNVAAFNSDNPANPYMEGEVNLGMIWNGSAFVARQAGTPIDVVWPKEGGIFWMDSLAIPANAKNKEGALKLINFLLRPDVAKQVAETIGYPTPNLAARKLLSPEVANDKTLSPDAETIKNGEWQNDVGAASSIYEEYYQKLKAGR
ncbi:extracellular solute-binding protein [Escherichia coli]